MADEEKTMRLWPLQPRHVECSGLRARRVGIVHKVAYCWRMYAPRYGSRKWTVDRVRVRGVDDLREDGEAVDVAAVSTRTQAAQAIEDNAKLLDVLGPPEPRRPAWSSAAAGGSD